MRWLDLSTQNIPIILLEKFMIHIISCLIHCNVDILKETEVFSSIYVCRETIWEYFFLWLAVFLYRIAVMWSGVVQVYYYHWSCHYPCCREKGGLDSCSAVQLATCYTLGQLVSTL